MAKHYFWGKVNYPYDHSPGSLSAPVAVFKMVERAFSAMIVSLILNGSVFSFFQSHLRNTFQHDYPKKIQCDKCKVNLSIQHTMTDCPKFTKGR